jgi:uncharacterized membrane protein (DUF2068 family)
MDRGLRVIIAYKAVKAVTGAVLCAVLAANLLRGDVSTFDRFAFYVRHHFAGAWAGMLARAIGSLSTRGHLWLVDTALGFDAVLTGIEGVGLWRRKWWAPWLVVLATSTLLPFELVAIARYPHAGRVALFAVNVAIVIYLARRIRQKHPSRSLG